MPYEDIDSIEVTSVDNSDFKAVPEGVYAVQITNIKKVIGKKFKSEEEEVKCLFEFTILDGDHSGEKIFNRVNPKLGDTPGKESTLFKLAGAVNGKKLIRNKDKKFDFHLTALKDAILQVVVEVTENDGKQYNNIVSYMKAK